MDQFAYTNGAGSGVLSKQSLSKASSPIEPWKNSVETVKPCWNKSMQGNCKFNIKLDVYEVYH